MKMRIVPKWIPALCLLAAAIISPMTSGAATLAEALDTTGLTWETGGMSAWIGQSAVTHDGVDAAMGEGTNGWSGGYLSTSVEGPGVLTFWWKLSTGGSYGSLRLSLGEMIGESAIWLNTDQDWQFVVLPVPMGSNQVQWSFDSSGTATNTPRAWVDQVVFTNTTPVVPTITNQPQNQLVFEGTTAAFTVAPDGTRPFTYLWRHDGVEVAGGTNQTLTIYGVTSNSLGIYQVAVSNSLGGVLSSNATLAMIPALPLPVALDTTNLTWQTSGPLDWVGQTNTTHDGVDAAQSGNPPVQGWMMTTITGPGMLTFWYWSQFQGIDFQLTNSSVTAASLWEWDSQGWKQYSTRVPAGEHTAVWSFYPSGGHHGSTSGIWIDQVAYVPDPPEVIITRDPADTVGFENKPARLTVEATGTPPLFYQWFFDGNPLDGQTSAELSFSSLTPDNAGPYRVVISNSINVVTSLVATLTVLPTLGLEESLDTTNLTWYFYNPWFGQGAISSDGVDAAHSPEVAAGDYAELYTSVEGPGTIRFVWKLDGPADDNFSFYIDGDYPKVTIMGTRDWVTNSFEVPAGYHSLRWLVYRQYGSPTMPVAWLDQVAFSPLQLPPTITQQPESVVSVEGGNAFFQVLATGSPTLSYQWYKGTEPLSGQTTAQLFMWGVTSNEIGGYFAVVTNNFGGVTSAVATLSFITSVPLADALDTTNLLWSTTSLAWFGQTNVSSDGQDAAQSPPLLPGSGSTYVYTDVTGPGTISFVWRAQGGSMDYSSFYLGSSSPSTHYGPFGWETNTFEVPDGAQSLYWSFQRSVNSTNNGTNALWVDQVAFTPAPPSAPRITNQPQTQVVMDGGTAQFSVGARGTQPLFYQWWGNGSLLAGETSSMLTLYSVTTNQSGPYWVVITNEIGGVTSDVVSLVVTLPLSLEEALDTPTLIWQKGGPVPWIGQAVVSHDTQDAAESGAIGNSQTNWFQTIVTGPGTLTYWCKTSSESGWDYLRCFIGGVQQSSLSGELGWTQLSFSVPAGEQVIRFEYTKDSCCTGGQDKVWVDEVVFTPSSGVPPFITQQPQNLVVTNGANATFTVSATGDPTQYRWHKAPGGPSNFIDWATGPTLTLTNVTPTNAGAYFVRVVNAFGSMVSSNATLAVILPPSIPLDSTNAPGINASGQFSFGFPTQPDVTYRVEFKNALEEVDWSFMTNVLGNGLNAVIIDLDPTGPSRYYRIVIPDL